MCKQGLNSDYVLNMPLLELGSWMDSALFINTGKRPLDPDIRQGMAERNSAAIKKLAEKHRSMKND